MSIYLEQLYCFNVILNVIFQYFAVLRLGLGLGLRLGLGFDKLNPARLFCANTGGRVTAQIFFFSCKNYFRH